MGLLSRAAKAAGKALDMSTEARMARAKAMGFDTERRLYHGTTADVQGGFRPSEKGLIGPGVYLTDSPSYAARYVGEKDGANIIPTYMRGRMARREDIDAAREAVEARGSQSMTGTQFNEAIDAELRARGFEGKDLDTQIVVWDPSNIRSIHAAFDPAKSKSSDLLAALAGVSLGGGLLSRAQTGGRV